MLGGPWDEACNGPCLRTLWARAVELAECGAVVEEIFCKWRTKERRLEVSELQAKRASRTWKALHFDGANRRGE